MSVSYRGFHFETQLLAQWAIFFDLAEWHWSRGIALVGNWVPDFHVSFSCCHSECSGFHQLLVSVLDVASVESVEGHPALAHRYVVKDHSDVYRGDGGAVFGTNPQATQWQMAHGAGAGIYDLPSWVDNSSHLWAQAHSVLQSLPRS